MEEIPKKKPDLNEPLLIEDEEAPRSPNSLTPSSSNTQSIPDGISLDDTDSSEISNEEQDKKKLGQKGAQRKQLLKMGLRKSLLAIKTNFQPKGGTKVADINTERDKKAGLHEALKMCIDLQGNIK